MPGRVRNPGPTTRKQPLVLVIEDDPAVRESLTALLEVRGFSVVAAGDGRAGLKLFRDLTPAVVVSDVLMPEEDGIGAMS